jgi:hypothetical protein
VAWLISTAPARVANALLDAVRAAAGKIGIDLVTLQVCTFNEEAQAFSTGKASRPTWRDFGAGKLHEPRSDTERHVLRRLVMDLHRAAPLACLHRKVAVR